MRITRSNCKRTLCYDYQNLVGDKLNDFKDRQRENSQEAISTEPAFFAFFAYVCMFVCVYVCVFVCMCVYELMSFSPDQPPVPALSAPRS